MISKQTVYLNEDRTEAVAEGDPSARYLLVREGHEIEPAMAEKYEGAAKLIGAGKSAAAEKKAEQSNEPPAPAHREQTLPKLRKRAKRSK